MNDHHYFTNTKEGFIEILPINEIGTVEEIKCSYEEAFYFQDLTGGREVYSCYRFQ